MIRVLVLLEPHLPSQALGRSKGLKVKLIARGQWFNQPWLCNKAFPLKVQWTKRPQKDRIHRASRLVNRWRFRDSGAPEEDVEDLSSALFPVPCSVHPCISSTWLFLNYTLSYWSVIALHVVFLLYSEVSQLYVYIYPLPLGLPSHPTPLPTLLGHRRTPSWAPCAYSRFPLALYFTHGSVYLPDFPGSSAGKESFCNAGDSGLILGLERSPGEGIGYPLQYSWASLVAQMVKNSPAMWKTWVRSLGWQDPLEEGMETYSSILAWRIPMDRCLAGYSPWGRNKSDTAEWLSTAQCQSYCQSSS